MSAAQAATDSPEGSSSDPDDTVWAPERGRSRPSFGGMRGSAVTPDPGFPGKIPGETPKFGVEEGPLAAKTLALRLKTASPLARSNREFDSSKPGGKTHNRERTGMWSLIAISHNCLPRNLLDGCHLRRRARVISERFVAMVLVAPGVFGPRVSSFWPLMRRVEQRGMSLRQQNLPRVRGRRLLSARGVLGSPLAVLLVHRVARKYDLLDSGSRFRVGRHETLEIGLP